MNYAEAIEISRNDPALAEYGREQLQSLLARSATDGEFRQKLLSDPRTAMAEHFGAEMPETLNLVFVENRADATIVLPDAVDPDAELSDAELEAVAGGVEPVTTICAAIAIGSALYVIGKKVFT